MNHISKSAKVLILTLNVIWLIYYIYLAYFNTLSQDDFVFMKTIKESGILYYTKEMYLYQTGRFSGVFLNSIFFYIILLTNQIIFVPIFYWLFNFVVIYYVLKSYKVFNTFLSVNYSILFVNIFILTNFEFTAFYWISASSYFIQPPLFLLIIHIVNLNKTIWFQDLILMLSSIFVSGTSETIVPLFIILLSFNLLFYFDQYKRNYSLLIKDSRFKKILIVAFLLTIGLIIVIVAPGNYKRFSMNEEGVFTQAKTFSEFLFVSYKSFIYFFVLVLFKMPYYIILILISFLSSLTFKASNNKIIFKFKYLLFSWIVYFSLIYLSVLPASYLMSDFGMYRIYTNCVFLTILFLIFQGFYIGTALKSYSELYKFDRLLFINLIILFVPMLYNISEDFPIAKSYNNTNNERIEFLLKLKNEGNTKCVYLKRLTKPVTYDLKSLLLNQKHLPMLYYSNEIEKDTNAYQNKCIQNYYELGFPIALKE